MRAILRTRCGCSRTVDVPEVNGRPLDSYDVALDTNMSVSVKPGIDAGPISYPIRTFKLVNIVRAGYLEAVAHYEEVR